MGGRLSLEQFQGGGGEQPGAPTTGRIPLDSFRGAPATPAAPSIWQRIGNAVESALPTPERAARALKMGVGNVVDAGGAAVGFFANPLNTVVNAALPGAPLSTHVGDGWSEALGLPQPENARERLIKDTSVGAGAGLLTAAATGGASAAMGAPSAARSFMQFLAEAPVVNTVAGGTSGLASGVTREAGGGEIAQAVAGLAGGIAGGVGAHVVGRPRVARPAATAEPALEYAPLDAPAPSGSVPLEQFRHGPAAAANPDAAHAVSQVAGDPMLDRVLNANLPREAKLATIWQRLEKVRSGEIEGVPDFAPVDASVPLDTPVRPAGIGSAARLDAITERTESRGRDVDSAGRVVTSSAGAKGRMQVLDGTNRDPGYGVRPAADDSLAERARVGRDYRAALTDHYGGDPARGWAAYNAGPGRLDAAIKRYGDDWLAHMPAETQAYVKKNMAALGDDVDGARLARQEPVTINALPVEPVASETRTGGVDDPLAIQRAPESGVDPLAPPVRVAVPEDVPPSPVAKPVEPPIDSQPGALQTPAIPEGRPAPAVPAAGGEKVGAVGDGSPATTAPLPARLPEDALTFIARNGGLRNDEGHSLRAGGRELAQYAPQGGHVFRKNGMSIDAAGELLHESGFFPERPTTSEVLEMLDRSASKRQYRPAEQGAAEDIEHARRQFGQRETALAQIDEHAQHYDLTPPEREAILGYVDENTSPGEAVERYFADRFHERMQEIHDATGNPEYDIPFDVPDRGGAEGAGRSGRVGRDEGGPARAAGETGTGERGEGRGTDLPDEARVEHPDALTADPRSDAERHAELDKLHPPGSEGQEFRIHAPNGVNRVGALDAARREIMRRASQAGDFEKHYDRIMKWKGQDATFGDIKVERGNPEALDARAANGVREDRAPMTPAERGKLIREGNYTAANGESGFITADMLLAPLRAAGNLVDWKGLRDDTGALLKFFTKTAKDPKAALEATTGRLSRFASAALYSADGSARSLADHFDSPTLRAFADLFHSEAGNTKQATARTYDEAIDRGTRTRIQQVYDALEPHMKDKPALSRIRDLLATPTATIGATAEERAAAVKIRDVLKEALEYRRAAGEDLGEVSDGYFPRVIEPQLVAANPVKFTRAAAALYRGIGLAAKDADEAADAWTLRVMDSYAGIDGGLDHVKPSSTPNSGKSRAFGKAADVALKEFYQADPFLTLSNYIQGSVKRAEQLRRFGPEGAVGSPERAAWETAHPGKTQWDVMLESIRDEVRASGKEAMGVMDRVAELKASNLGQIAPTNRYVKNAVSMLHTWNQLSKMDRVTVSSLGDLTMGFVRGGPKYGFQHLGESLKQFGRQVAKMKPDDATRYAEAIGTANDAFGSAVMLARTDANYTGAGSHELIDKFYRGVGLQQLTDGGRIAATKTGQRFLSVLADDLQSTNARTRTRAAGYLRELGVKDPDAFGQQLRGATPTPDEILTDKGFAADYATAVLRYVNQSIIMPSRAQKPTWANHPLGNLFFALQGYSYGFKKNVLDRVGRETKSAFTERDPRKLAAASGLAMLVGFQYLNDTYLRPALFGSNYDFASETPQQAAMRTIDRAGILGPLSGVWNAFHPTKYNRGPAAALAGPILGDISDQTYKTVKWAFADNPNTNTDERAAAGALYDMVVEPAGDALAAARLRGPARTAAIMGTGQRASNGILPGDREAFVSRLAGEKK